MFPVMVDVARLPVLLIGEGRAAEQRLGLLDAAGATRVRIYSRAPSLAFRARAGDRLVGERPDLDEVETASLVLLAGLDEPETERFASAARNAGRLVNAEDVKAWCDFHVPSVVRRGDLLFTVSTNGRAPGLARRLTRWLAEKFEPEWAEKLDEIARHREAWRREGLKGPEVGRRVDQLIEEKGWLA